MLQRFGKFQEELVRKYTRQLLLGLEYLHSRNIMYRWKQWGKVDGGTGKGGAGKGVWGGHDMVTRDGIVQLTTSPPRCA